MANTVEDPNQDPNLYSEIDVVYCITLTIIDDFLEEKKLINVARFFRRQSKIEKSTSFYIYDDELWKIIINN